MIKRALAAVAASMSLVVGLAACGTESQGNAEPTNQLELISWWTSGECCVPAVLRSPTSDWP